MAGVPPNGGAQPHSRRTMRTAHELSSTRPPRRLMSCHLVLAPTEPRSAMSCRCHAPKISAWLRPLQDLLGIWCSHCGLCGRNVSRGGLWKSQNPGDGASSRPCRSVDRRKWNGAAPTARAAAVPASAPPQSWVEGAGQSADSTRTGGPEMRHCWMWMACSSRQWSSVWPSSGRWGRSSPSCRPAACGKREELSLTQPVRRQVRFPSPAPLRLSRDFHRTPGNVVSHCQD